MACPTGFGRRFTAALKIWEIREQNVIQGVHYKMVCAQAKKPSVVLSKYSRPDFIQVRDHAKDFDMCCHIKVACALGLENDYPVHNYYFASKLHFVLQNFIHKWR